MTHPPRAGYSLAQIALHWTVVVLVIFQYLANDSMDQAWRSVRNGEAVPEALLTGANIHAAVGLTILALALARLYLRLTRGAPPVPPTLAPPLKIVAKVTHFLLYALIIALPMGGAAAWIGGVIPAGSVHRIGANVLFWVAILHALGALYEHFIARNDVLMRMLKPES